MTSALDPLPWLVALLGWATLVSITILVAAVRYWHRTHVARAQRHSFWKGYAAARTIIAPGAVSQGQHGVPRGGVDWAPVQGGARGISTTTRDAIQGLSPDEAQRARRLLQQVWT